METRRKPYQAIRCEIEAMVPTIMAGPLSRWGEWTDEDKRALVAYIDAELDGVGDLSIAKGIECEAPMGEIRAQARRLGL
jgi:hypothetical protein